MANGVYASMTELQVLNYVFNKNSIAILSDNGITEEYFTTYKEHYKFIIDFYNKYNALPSRETFQSKFCDQWEWLNVTDSTDYLIKKLKESCLFRSLVGDFKELGNLIKEEKTDLAVEKMAQLSQQYMKSQGSSCVRLAQDIQQRLDSYHERMANPDSAYVTTGLAELDGILGGWDLLNESAMICARTGVGKSWMLVYFAMQAAKAGLRVGYYSGEMEPDLIGYRFDTFLGNLPNGSLTHGNNSIDDKYTKYAQSIGSVVKGDIYCITADDPMFNGSVTVSKLRAFIEKYDLQMLCVDQFSLLDDQKGARTPREQAVNISKDLRALQRLKKIPILSAVQLNREDTSDNGPSTKNISESDRIGQDATTVIFIETRGDIMSLIIGKSRNSRSGDKLTYDWNKNMGILRYIPSATDACGGKESEEVREEFVDKSDSVF